MSSPNTSTPAEPRELPSIETPLTTRDLHPRNATSAQPQPQGEAQQTNQNSTKASHYQASRPAPLQLNSSNLHSRRPGVPVTGIIPTPKTPVTSSQLYKIIAEYRAAYPESCGVTPSAGWTSNLSPSFRSPDLYPVEKIVLKPAVPMTEPEAIAAGLASATPPPSPGASDDDETMDSGYDSEDCYNPFEDDDDLDMEDQEEEDDDGADDGEDQAEDGGFALVAADDGADQAGKTDVQKDSE